MAVRSIPMSSPNPLAALSAANGFGMDVFRRLYARAPYDNLVMSPLSLWLVLSMTIGGARGATLREMRDVMRLDDDVSLVDLALLYEATCPMTSRGKVSLGNMLAIHSGVLDCGILPTFGDFCRQAMGAELMLCDFSDPGTADRINGWISNVTAGRIVNLLSDLTPEDRLVLVNAIRFLARWDVNFDDVGQDTFWEISGEDTARGVKCDMMRKKERMWYLREDDWQMVKIPYDGGTMSMRVVLPDLGVGIGEMLNRMDEVDQAGVSMRVMADVDLLMPKFSVKERLDDLIGVLYHMGMHSAFSPGEANFSAMSATPGLYIGKIIHGAMIIVNALGTEAVAATLGIAKGLSSAPPLIERIHIRVDRPFIYSIIDERSGLVIFHGVLNTP